MGSHEHVGAVQSRVPLRKYEGHISTGSVAPPRMMGESTLLGLLECQSASPASTLGWQGNVRPGVKPQTCSGDTAQEPAWLDKGLWGLRGREA